MKCSWSYSLPSCLHLMQACPRKLACQTAAWQTVVWCDPVASAFGNTSFPSSSPSPSCATKFVIPAAIGMHEHSFISIVYIERISSVLCRPVVLSSFPQLRYLWGSEQKDGLTHRGKYVYACRRSWWSYPLWALRQSLSQLIAPDAIDDVQLCRKTHSNISRENPAIKVWRILGKDVRAATEPGYNKEDVATCQLGSTSKHIDLSANHGLLFSKSSRG